MIWNTEEVLEKLQDDDLYYGEYGSRWLSASTLKKYLKGDCPYEDNKNEYALRFGGLFHQAILEPDKYAAARVSEKEHKDIMFLKDSLENSHEYFIMDGVTQVETPYIGSLNGIDLKCKVDAETDKILIDLKTTSNIDVIEYTSKHFGYHISAYQYWMLTRKTMAFLYVEKKTGRVRLVYPDKKFYEDGRRDWMWAMRNYRQSLKKHWLFTTSTDMKDQRFIMDNVHMKADNGKLYAWTYTDENLNRRK